MKIYEINGMAIAVIGGELWLKVNEVGCEPEAAKHVEFEEPVVRRGRPKKAGGKGRVRLQEYQKAAIRTAYSDGITVKELAAKYGVSTFTVYGYVKNAIGPKSNPIAKKNDYICEAGHRFTSNLSMLEAKCPTCGSRDLERPIERPVREE